MSDSIKDLSPPRSASKATESNTQDFNTFIINDRDVNSESIISEGENRECDSQSYEELAFRSQFEEVNQAVARLLESNRTNNQYSRGRSINGPLSGLLPPKRTEYTHHHRTYSQPAFWGTPNHHVVRHQRSTSSLDGTSSHATYYTPLPQIPHINGYNIYAQDLDEYHPYFEPNISSRKVENGSSRFGFKYESDWSPASNPFSSFGYGSFNPSSLSPSSSSSPLSSSSSSSYSSINPYFGPSRALLDDDELLRKQIQLETDRKLLQLQQRRLDNAIAMHSIQFDSECSFPATDSTETPPISLENESPKFFATSVSNREKDLPSLSTLKNLSILPRPFNQEPIGTPNRKSGPSTPNSLTDSNSSPASGFSLFAQSPTMSLNHALASCNNNLDTSFDSFAPFDSLPLFLDTPPKEEDGYFESYRNANMTNLDNMQQHSALFAHTPFFSSPVHESDEEVYWNDEVSFDEFDPQKSSSGPIEDDWDHCHERMAAMTKKHREREATSPEALTRRSRNLSHGSNGPTFAATIARRSSESQLSSTYHMFDKGSYLTAHTNRLSQNFAVTQEDPKNNNRIKSQMLKEEFSRGIQQPCEMSQSFINRQHFAANNQTLNSHQGLFDIVDPTKQRIGGSFQLKKQQPQSNMFQRVIGDIDTQLQSVNEMMMNLKIRVQQPSIFHHLHGSHGLEVV